MKKLFSTRVSESALAFGLLLTRVGMGSAMMINHGLDKLSHFNKYAAHFPSYLGWSPKLWLSLTVFAELFCAAFIVLGLFTRLAAIPLVIAMSVALFDASNGQFFGKGELPGLFLLFSVLFLIVGPGKYSLDRMLGK